MTDLLHQFLKRILTDAPEYTAILGLLMVAAIANMPLPEVIAKLLGSSRLAQWASVGYKWLYDTLQAFMAARNPHSAPPPIIQSPTPNPTPAVAPPKP